MGAPHEPDSHRSGGGVLPMLVGIALVGCSFHGRASGDDPPANDATRDGDPALADTPRGWLDGFAHRKKVTIVAAPEELVGFPTPIQIANDADLAGTPDVAFTAEDGTTLLPMEFSDFGLPEGSMTQWIRVDRHAGAPTIVWLYYGGGPVPHASGAAVWQ